MVTEKAEGLTGERWDGLCDYCGVQGREEDAEGKADGYEDESELGWIALVCVFGCRWTAGGAWPLLQLDGFERL